MLKRALFIDGSVDTKSKIGFGAYLTIDDWNATSDHSQNIKVKRFENTSSTKLELQTLLWACEQSGVGVSGLTVYTDSQNIINLPSRRKRLQENRFLSGNGRPLSNHKLYEEFYRMLDNWECRFIKVKGHQVKSEKGRIEEIFTLVDRAARVELRKFRASSP